ncbi:hypothetical protein Slala02_19620 [Streptomyces lavendulae subsp. lavendulae]|nr:hypothetical protein Slala02_19620 [Streptomyces lavendulae subsp. lavendulae]
MAEATANPRTEIRLTRCPSSSVRSDRAVARVPLDTGLRGVEVTGDAGPWATPLRGLPAVPGGIRTSAVELFVLRASRNGDTGVPYAGPDGNQTLPDLDAARQFCVACERSHLLGYR